MTDIRPTDEKEIVLFDLAASPNNMKARIALNFKGLPFRKIPVDPMDRAPIIEASGQPLTPVMLHGDTVVYDSRAYRLRRHAAARNRTNGPHRPVLRRQLQAG